MHLTAIKSLSSSASLTLKTKDPVHKLYKVKLIWFGSKRIGISITLELQPVTTNPIPDKYIRKIINVLILS